MARPQQITPESTDPATISRNFRIIKGLLYKLDASGIAYDAPCKPGVFSTVADALNDIHCPPPPYVPPGVSLSGGGSYEKGATVGTVTLNWVITENTNPVTSMTLTCNKPAYNVGAITPIELVGSRQFIVTEDDSNVTWTLTAVDPDGQGQNATSVTFFQYQYWGMNANITVDDAAIIALENRNTNTTRQQTRIFDPFGKGEGAQYLYFAWPATAGLPTKWEVNDMPSTSWHPSILNPVPTQSHQNAQGYDEDYYVFRSVNALSGTNIKVRVF